MPAADMTHARPALDISVVFATRNRAAQLAKTLDAYRQLDTSDIAWELVVIDNNSSDQTAAVLERAEHDLPLHRVFVEQAGQNRARNAVMADLAGRLVVFTDDDVLPAQDYLKAYLSAAERWPDDAIFGARIDPLFPPGTPAWLADPGFSFATTAFARYAPANAEGHVKRHPYGPSFAVRGHVLRGYRFPEHLGPQQGAYAMGGEGEFLRRIAADGYRYVYVPTARVAHVIRPEQVQSAWLLQRARNKGRGQAHLPSSKPPRQLFFRGAPLRLWLKTLRTAFRYWVLGAFASAEKRLQMGIRYNLRRGQLDELLEKQIPRQGMHGDR